MITNKTTFRQMVADHVTELLALDYAQLALFKTADLDATEGTLRVPGVIFEDDIARVEELDGYTADILRLWLEVRGREPGPLFVLPAKVPN